MSTNEKKNSNIFTVIILLLVLMLLWGFIGGFSLKHGEIKVNKAQLDLDNWGYKLLALVLPVKGFSEPAPVNNTGILEALVTKVLPLGSNIAYASNNKNADKQILGILPDENGLVFLNQFNQNGGKLDKTKPLVAIYSSHSAETYTPYSGEPKIPGKRGGVYKADETLAQALKQYNIASVIDYTIHDYPDWKKSYSNSAKTATKLMREYPSTRILIDLHRDAGIPKSATTCRINGKPAARIMLEVGTNKRSYHPNWQTNKAFMEKIGHTMEAMYPGLLKAVRAQSGRYNQNIFTGAILVEMGGTENTIAEVEYSSVLLADVLAKILLKP